MNTSNALQLAAIAAEMRRFHSGAESLPHDALDVWARRLDGIVVAEQGLGATPPPVPQRVQMMPAPGVNPWKVIGWIALACILLPIGACVAGVAVMQYQGFQDRTEAAQQEATP